MDYVVPYEIHSLFWAGFCSVNFILQCYLHVTHKHYNFSDLSDSVDIGEDPVTFIGQAVKNITGIWRH